MDIAIFKHNKAATDAWEKMATTNADLLVCSIGQTQEGRLRLYSASQDTALLAAALEETARQLRLKSINLSNGQPVSIS